MSHEEVARLLQIALVGEVSPALRWAGFSLAGRRVALVFFYDGPISDEDRESASCVETEVIAGLPDDVQVSTEVIRLDSPARPPEPDRWVYGRRE